MNKFIITASLFLLAACGHDPKKASGDLVNNPLSATDTAANLGENAPSMTFDENIHDFGKLMDGEVVTYKFKFKNTGKSDLIISNASASCGCTVPSYPKEPLAPGSEAAIDVQFNSSGKSGVVEKNITITANTIPTQVFLIIRADVKPKQE